jgi:zinc protease
LQSIKQREESPATLAQLAFYQQIFKKHPYANPIEGTATSVEKISLNDIADFHRKHYVGERLTIVLVGGVSRKKAEQLVEQLAGNLDKGAQAIARPPVEALERGSQLHKEYTSQQTHLFYGLPATTHNDPDYFALSVGNHILGGSGFNSRIVKEIRENRGLAYSAYSYFRPMVEKGPFIVGLQTRNEKAQEASKAVKQTLVSFIENGPTEEELIAAKKNINGGFALKLDSNKKLLGQVVSIVASGAPLDYLNIYLQKIKAVTRVQIQDAFKRHIDVDKMALVTVGQIVSDTK